MRGLDWAAVPIMVELLDVDDVDWFVRSLISIREHQIEMEELLKEK